MSVRSNGGLELAATTAELRNSIMMNHPKVLRRIIPWSVRLVSGFHGGVGEREVIRFLPLARHSTESLRFRTTIVKSASTMVGILRRSP
jgi:hypothetical protein